MEIERLRRDTALRSNSGTAATGTRLRSQQDKSPAQKDGSKLVTHLPLRAEPLNKYSRITGAKTST
jgi:hypothetical protein